jgi:hypothetical protein
MRKFSGPIGLLNFGLMVTLLIVVGISFQTVSATKKSADKTQNEGAQTSTGTNSQDTASGGGMMGRMMNMCPMMRRRSSPNFEPMQYGYDIVDAKDYRAFDLPEPRPELCEAACNSETRCKAYTYTKPGTYDNPKAKCWLKETQGRFVTHDNAISAVKK